MMTKLIVVVDGDPVTFDEPALNVYFDSDKMLIINSDRNKIGVFVKWDYWRFI